MKSNFSEKVEINDTKLNRIKLSILKLERENLKTRDKTNDEMVENIRRIIMDEVKKNY